MFGLNKYPKIIFSKLILLNLWCNKKSENKVATLKKKYGLQKNKQSLEGKH